MMTQVAIARPRIPSKHASKPPRNNVPAFIQKTYKIVNDTNNSDIICWSESGGSFLILDHQRLAHQVLGRWFKHENFNSFVRQLNNYGFYKIPDLQQGSLRNVSGTDYCCFAHVHGHFRRGEPGLLRLIRPGAQIGRTRNQNPAHTQSQVDDNDDTTMDLVDDDDDDDDSPTLSSPSNAADFTTVRGPLPDGPATFQDIKREQTKQATELDKLRHAYQLLRQEYMDCRTKLQEQQQTIGRILDFLARVFETHHAKNNKGDTGGPDGAPDAVILRRTIGPTVQGAPGTRGDESPGSFEVIEVDADASEGKNNVSMYSIEAPVEGAGSPAASITTSDDGHAGDAATNYHDPRTPVGPVYDGNPHHHNTISYFNPNITPDNPAYHLSSLPPNVNDPRYGEEEQARVLASALDFSTPQTPSPLRPSRYTPMSITEASNGNPGMPEGLISFDVDTIIDSIPIPFPVHIPPGLGNHFPAAEGTGHEVNALGYHFKGLDDLFFPCGSNESSSTTSPAMSTFVTTPQNATAPYFTSTTSSPTSRDTPATPTNIAPPTFDALPLNIPTLSMKPDFDPDMFLGLFSHSAGAGIGSYGSDNWANGASDDTMNVEDGTDTGVCMDVTGDGTGSWVYVGGLGGAEAQYLDKVSPRSSNKMGLESVPVTPPVAGGPLPAQIRIANDAANGSPNRNTAGNSRNRREINANMATSTSATSTLRKRKSDEMTSSMETRGNVVPVSVKLRKKGTLSREMRDARERE